MNREADHIFPLLKNTNLDEIDFFLLNVFTAS